MNQRALNSNQKQTRSFNVRDYDKNATVQTGPGLPRWDWRTMRHAASPGPCSAIRTLALLPGARASTWCSPSARGAAGRCCCCACWASPAASGPARGRQRAARPPRRLATGRCWPCVLALVLTRDLPRSPAAWKSVDVPEPSHPRARSSSACWRSPTARPPAPRVPACSSRRARSCCGCGSRCSPAPRPPCRCPVTREPSGCPRRCVLDGKAAAALRRQPDGTLWLAGAPGAHQVVAGRRAAAARHGADRACRCAPTGWKRSSTAGRSTACTKTAWPTTTCSSRARPPTTKGQGASLQVGTLPPFVRVERTLVLGLQWTVETRVDARDARSAPRWCSRCRCCPVSRSPPATCACRAARRW